MGSALSLLGCRVQSELMLNYFTTVTLPLLATVTTQVASLPLFPPPPVTAPSVPFSIVKEFETPTATKQVATEKPKEKRLICKGCNENENIALDYFQDIGIKDKNALATILGNIKQESKFYANVCEGGSIRSYHSCWGGYGLIQWTSSSRYYGLGDFARKYGGSPSSIGTQLRYLTNEEQWRQIEDRMKTPGRSIYDYMNAAYEWIGWGIHGNRTYYAYDYLKRFETTYV